MSSWTNVAWAAVHAHGAQHDVTELATLLGILDNEVSPERVIETGTARGGSAWAWSQLPTVRLVVTIDPAPGRPGEPIATAGARIIQVPADSTLRATRDRVWDLLDPQLADLLVIDGAHDYASARADWDLYTDLLNDPAVIVVHDTQGYPGNPGIEVPRLWAEIRKGTRHLELVSRRGGPGGTGVIWR